MKTFCCPSFPALDNTGQIWIALGIWAHIFSGLVISRPEMAITLGNIIAIVMVVAGGYRVLDARLHRVEMAERQKLAATAAKAQRQEDGDA